MSYDYTMPDGSVIKVVPEQDLIAVKTGAERREGELTTQMGELKTISDGATQTMETNRVQLLQAQTAKEQLETQLAESNGSKEKADTLQGELTTATGKITELGTAILDLKKLNLSSQYNVAIETLEGKTTEQLDSLTEALKLVGVPNRPANLDLNGGGGGGSTAPLSGLELCGVEMEALKKK